MNTFSFNEYKRSNNENQYWNTLKVTAVGSTLKFYINNILVWQGERRFLWQRAGWYSNV